MKIWYAGCRQIYLKLLAFLKAKEEFDLAYADFQLFIDFATIFNQLMCLII